MFAVIPLLFRDNRIEITFYINVLAFITINYNLLLKIIVAKGLVIPNNTSIDRIL